MSPAAFLLLVQGIQAAISAAPGIIEVVIEAKNFIATLFGHAIITKEQQDALYGHVDAITAAVEAGMVPPEFKVDPDPVA